MSGTSKRTLLLLLLLHVSSVRGGPSGRRLTQYGCEGSDLQISCPSSHVIRLVRANFGRFSISICNDVGNTEWSVNCMEPRTLRVIKGRCDARNACRIPVNATLFGDPCPGTQKYVEVHYTCQPAGLEEENKLEKEYSDNLDVDNTSKEKNSGQERGQGDDQRRQLPPWLYELGATPPAIDDIDTTTSTTSTTESNLLNEDEPEVGNDEEYVSNADSDHLGHVGPLEKKEEVVEEHPSLSSSSLASLASSELATTHCAPRSSRFLFWNWTASNSEAIQLCPPGTSGFARWHCTPSAEWQGGAPDLSECQSLWLSRLDARLHAPSSSEDDEALSVASELALATASKTLYGGDVAQLASVIRGLTHRLRRRLYEQSSHQARTEAAVHVWTKAVESVSNLLANDPTHENQSVFNGRGVEETWPNHMAVSKLQQASLDVLDSLQNDCSRLLANTVKKESRLQRLESNLDAFVRVLRARELSDQLFRSEHGDQLVVPARALLQSGASVNGAVRLSAFFYRGMERRLRSRSKHFFVNSNVVALTLANNEEDDALDNKNDKNDDDEALEVFFTVRHLRSEQVRTPVCVAFDRVEWNSDQCVLLASNKTHTVCKCHVVAVYSVLMQEDFEQAEQFNNQMETISDIDSQSVVKETRISEERTTRTTLETSTTTTTTATTAATATTTWILLLLAVFLSVLIVSTLLVCVKRLELRPRVRKLVHASSLAASGESGENVVGNVGNNVGNMLSGNVGNGVSSSMGNSGSMGGVFRSKKTLMHQEGFYPALTSSPTSTTVSNGNVTPNSTTTNPYLEQMLEQPVYEPRIVSCRTGPNGRPMVALNQCDPFGHHIYMEIDPIYAALERHGDHADHLDHLRTHSEQGRQRCQQTKVFPSSEERPLIRHQQSNNKENAWSTLNGGGHLLPHVDAAPLTIAMQGNDQFVSLRLNDSRRGHEEMQQQQHLLMQHQQLMHMARQSAHSLRR